MRTASEWCVAFQTGSASPVEAVQMSLERIAAVDPQLGAFITVCPELALTEAKASEERWREGRARSPIDGVPIAVKDTTPTAGVRTTFGSVLFKDHVPKYDATCWAQLKSAGAVLVGKANTSEFGSLPATDNMLVERTRNPWNHSKTSGGSSGGSAVAVAAGMVPLAEGTDGGGSLRIPSSCCGTVALKPSRGRVSAGPAFGVHVGGTTNGPIATSAIDCQLMLNAMQGPDIGDPYGWVGPAPGNRPPIRLGILESASFAPVDPQICEALQRVGNEMERIGLTIEPVELPLEGLVDPIFWSAGLGALPVKDLNAVHPLLREQIIAGREVKAVVLEQTSTRLHRRSRDLRLALEPYDAVLLPVLPTLPKPIGFLDDASMNDVLSWVAYTYPANIAGLPAVSFPGGSSADGLPIGVQLMGHHNSDEQLLALVARWEAARGLPHPSPRI